MAIRKVIESDISGRPDAETVTFGLSDTWYEIDLTSTELKELHGLLGTYLDKGRKASLNKTSKRMVPETSAEEREKIREWGRKQGMQFAERGRIPKQLQEAYDKAHGINRNK